MNDTYTFYPPIKQTININQFRVNIVELKLFESVTVCALLLNPDGQHVDNKIYKLEGDDYTNWSNDDKYIVNYVKLKLQQESNN